MLPLLNSIEGKQFTKTDHLQRSKITDCAQCRTTPGPLAGRAPSQGWQGWPGPGQAPSPLLQQGTWHLESCRLGNGWRSEEQVSIRESNTPSFWRQMSKISDTLRHRESKEIIFLSGIGGGQMNFSLSHQQSSYVGKASPLTQEEN